MFSDALVKQLAQAYRDAWGAFVALHADSLPRGSVELGERVGNAFEWLLDELSRPPLTLVHGDFRAMNGPSWAAGTTRSCVGG
jgi:hypothetical protein